MSRTYEEIVTPLGRLVEGKQRNYGDSFGMETKDPIGTFVDARNEELATENELWMRWSAVVWAEWQDQGDAGWTFTASCETCDCGETVWSRLSEQADLLRVEKETFARMALPLPPSPPSPVLTLPRALLAQHWPEGDSGVLALEEDNAA